MTEKPLFIPLKAEYYEAFEDGSKLYELRLEGPRWNARTCRVGRAAVLSYGYGKARRLNRVVSRYDSVSLSDLSDVDAAAVAACYGATDKRIAKIWLGVEFLPAKNPHQGQRQLNFCTAKNQHERTATMETDYDRQQDRFD